MGVSVIEHVWSVLCSKTIVDPRSNNVSLIEVVEQLVIEKRAIDDLPSGKEPVLPVPMELVSLWQRIDYSVPVDGDMQTLLLGPDNTPLATPGPPPILKINLKGEAHRFRSFGKINGIPFKGAGNYKFLIQ